MDFLNAMNPSGGQFASLSDFITLGQTLISARHSKSQLSQHYLQKWLRPVHALEDDLTEVGLVWEIVKALDTNGRARRIYQKSEHHTFSITVVASERLFSGQCGWISYCCDGPPYERLWRRAPHGRAVL